jgi:hypothetical protein
LAHEIRLDGLEALNDRPEDAVAVIDEDQALIGRQDQVLPPNEAERPPRHVIGHGLADELLARVEDSAS